jgi:hypothetical protein
MSLIKKIDVEKYFAARRARRLGRTGLLGQVGARIEPAAKAKSASASIEEVTPGHSSLSTPVTPIPITADSDGTSVFTVLRSRQS